MNNNQLYNKILKDISKVVKASINEAFDFGSAGKTTQKKSAIISTVRHEVLKKNIEDYLTFCWEYITNGKDEFTIDDSTSGCWILKSEGYRGQDEHVKIQQSNNSVFDCTINSRSISTFYRNEKTNGKEKSDVILEMFTGAAQYHLNIGTGIIKGLPNCTFNLSSLENISLDTLPSKLVLQDAWSDKILTTALSAIVNDNNSSSLDSMMPMIEYMQDNFVDVIFAGFSGAAQDFINENIYRMKIPNVQEYLKSRKLKCEAKDLQRVEDLIKKGKSCEAMAKAIGEKNISKAGSRFVAALRLLNLPSPAIDDNGKDMAWQVENFYDKLRQLCFDTRALEKTVEKFDKLMPQYFLLKFLQLGGTMQDIFAMYEASFGDEENPDTIANRQQKINDFQGTSVKKYGRLKDFVIFLDSLNIPYEVEPIDSRITDRWSNPQAWQGVTLFDDDDPNTAHFAITSSEGATRGHGDRTGSTRITGGWSRGRYRSVYAPEYAENGNWRMEGELEITHISDNLLPFIQEGPINLTKLRTAIQKFLKSLK